MLCSGLAPGAYAPDGTMSGGVMATNTIARSNAPRKSAEIPVRNITDDDLRFALRQGFEDFKTFRSDVLIAGLIHTLIGLAAVVMTTSKPLMPFFLPVVAGRRAARSDRRRRIL